MPVEYVCAMCKSPAKQRCSCCQAVYYCTRAHQLSDWKNHSKNCKACNLVKDSAIGMHYVATKNIKIGERVLSDETPVVTGPYYLTIETECGPVIITLPVCLSCYVKLTADSAKSCCKCGLPLCRNCTQHGGECDFTVKYGKRKFSITRYDKSDPVYKSIATIRALALRKSDPEAYRKLLSLEEQCIGTARQSNVLDGSGQIARFVKSLFNLEDVEEAEIARIAAILQMKTHVIEITDSSYTAVYFNASYFEHNCRANCSKSFTADGGIVVWAAVPISKDDRITINYIDDQWGTLKRRHHLGQTHFFNCICERCKDRTEFGTMFSAFRCIKVGCSGFMLPPTFMFYNREFNKKLPNFICNKCNKTKLWIVINKMEKHIDTELLKKKDVHARRRYIESLSKILHENHFFNVTVMLDWIFAVGDVKTILDLVHQSDEVLNDLIYHCKRLSELYKTLAPAENRIRGKLLFIQTHANISLHFKYEPVNRLDAFEYVVKSKKILAEMHQLMCREPPTCCSNYKIREYALKELESAQAIEKFAIATL